MLAAVLAAGAASLQAPATAGESCIGQENCERATSSQMFALADQLFTNGDLAGAEQVLMALAQDPDPHLRAEARFRLAALHERRGDLQGAVEALQELLAEQPQANPARLELSRILALQGKDAAARRELRRAEAVGLPPEVERTVRPFSAALASRKRRGASLELSAGPDSNINRSTSDELIDTVIAPFVLDPDARRQSGIGATVGGQLWSRDRIGGVDLLSRVGAHGDFFGKSKFNDVQLSINSGPEFSSKLGRIRPALIHERRWFGGRPYSVGYGGSFSWLFSPGARSRIEMDASIIRQAIRPNPALNGTRYSLSVALDQALSQSATARFLVRGAVLDAESRPDSVRQAGLEVVSAQRFSIATLFAAAGYTKTRGIEPVALFAKIRDDDRFDIGTGIIAHKLSFAHFSPLVRITYTKSKSNIELYDYRRTRLEFGLSRNF